MKTLGFLSGMGGQGRTMTVSHLAWMYQELGLSVVVLDFAPQADLTAAFLSDERLAEVWSEKSEQRTSFGLTRSLLEQEGRVGELELESLGDRLALLPGDPRLFGYRDQFAQAWTASLSHEPGDPGSALRTLTVFYLEMELAERTCKPDLILVDAGDHLDAITREVLIGCDSIIMPLRGDIFTLRSLPDFGRTLRLWREGWRERLRRHGSPDLVLPSGEMAVKGYIVLERSSLDEHERIPPLFHHAILGEPEGTTPPIPDPYEFATLHPYRGLLQLARDTRKPMFLLKPADGAIGSYAVAVKDCYRDFKTLALKIANRCGVAVP